MGELGHLLWLNLAESYKEIARAWLFAARESWALPVLSRGLLCCRRHARHPERRVRVWSLRPASANATMCICSAVAFRPIGGGDLMCSSAIFRAPRNAGRHKCP